MVDIYVLDENLKRIYIIDDYKSLLWVNRYNEIGDCEIEIMASTENLLKFTEGRYIVKEDDDMICRIEKININTDVEEGDYLIITGYDCKKILKQRIIWKQTNFNGLVEDYIRKLIDENLINPVNIDRKINNFKLSEKNGFTEKIKQQATYDNLIDKIEEICKKYNWGYKVYTDYNNFIFKLYKGTDRSKTVIFSNDYENLESTQYEEDKTGIINVALIAGEGEGIKRITTTIGQGIGIERYETYVDARDISKTIDYDELKKTYTGGKEVTIGNTTYYQVNNVNIATLVKDEGSEETEGNVEATLTEEIYNESLNSRGKEKLIPATKSFEGNIVPSYTFTYKKDYFLGDIVTVKNEYGIILEARIIETREVYNENGYSLEPIYEYLEDI